MISCDKLERFKLTSKRSVTTKTSLCTRRSAANVKRQTTNFTSPKPLLSYVTAVKPSLDNIGLTSQTSRRFRKISIPIWSYGHWPGITLETSRSGWKDQLLTQMAINYQKIYLTQARNFKNCNEALSETQLTPGKYVMT